MTTGQITSRELTEIYLERIERYGDLLQCYVTVTPGVARSQADQADRERATGPRARERRVTSHREALTSESLSQV